MSSAADATPSEPQDAEPNHSADGEVVSLPEDGVVQEPTSEPTFTGYGHRRLWLMRNEQWLIYCLPFIVFMAVGSLEPKGPVRGVFAKEQPMIGYPLYPYIYSAKIGLTCLAMLWVWPGYRQFAFRVTPLLSIAVGAFGAVIWIGVCKWQQTIDPELLKKYGLDMLAHLGARSGYNPLVQLHDDPAWAWGFLAVRFFGLVIVVPIIEEFFLRGFLMRFFIHEDWWTVPFATATPLAIAVGTLVPMMMHPGELIAAALWFSLITWLMYKTKSIWDCILAHATTNLCLGLWVVYSGDWFMM